MAMYIDAKYLGTCETCRHFSGGKCDTWCDHGECYQPNLSKIPTADVAEVKHGKWYRHKEDCLYNKCSVCLYDHCREDNYCPNCGAKMDGDKR